MQRTVKHIGKYIALLVSGGLLYYLIEIVVRSYSHWTMFLVGGLCFVLVGLLNEITPEMPLPRQMLLSMILITVIEFAAGCVINLWLGWNVWDYSGRAFNLLGQVCLKNTLYWFLLSAPAIVSDDYLRHWIFGEERPNYKLF